MTSIRACFYITWVVPLTLLAVAGCDSGGAVGYNGESTPSAVAPYTLGIQVAWDARTRVRVKSDGASYARLVRAQEDNHPVGYDRDGQIYARRSTDDGRSWGERGVWEPIIRQLPSGALQLYAANEYPYTNSDDQEITVWRSTDRGRSWLDGTTVSYQLGHRDGMPVPLLLQDGGIVLTIEDNGMGGPFKPAIVDTPRRILPGQRDRLVSAATSAGARSPH